MVGIRITGIDIFILKTFYIIGNYKAVQRYSISFTGNVFHISISCTVPESVTFSVRKLIDAEGKMLRQFFSWEWISPGFIISGIIIVIIGGFQIMVEITSAET